VSLSVDANFIRRVYRTSAWVGAVVLLYLLSSRNWKIIAGFACGVIVALALLKSHEILVPRLLSACSGKKREWALTLGLVIIKYAALVAAFWALFAHNLVSAPAFFGGIVLVQSVIFLKVVGLVMVGKLNVTQTKADSRGCQCTSDVDIPA